MNIINDTFTFKNVSLDYKVAMPRRDRRHLVVVFSGGFVGGYDFDGASFSRLGSIILWIRDRDNSYYIQKNGDPVYEEAVQALISRMLIEFGLSKHRTTLLGTSKGGAAALYHGLKYDFKNIVAAVPRIYPAAGNIGSRREIFEEILGNLNERTIRSFDKLLPDLLETSSTGKNLYVFTSKDDVQYKTEIEPNLYKFRRFENFNIVCTSSTNVRQHEDVTLYNIPIIVAIVSMLIDGIAPRFGEVKNGSNALNERGARNPIIGRLQDQPILTIDSVDLDARGLYLRGRGFLLYRNAADYGDVRRYLQLSSPRHETVSKFYLGGLRDRRNNRDFEQGTGHDYFAGSYATEGNEPQSLDDLPYGDFDCAVEIHQDSQVKSVREMEGSEVSFFRAIKNYIIRITFKDRKLRILKMPLQDFNEHNGTFKLDHIGLNGNLLSVQGSLGFTNVEAYEWNNVQFRLVLSDTASKAPTINLNLAKDKGAPSAYPWRRTNVNIFTTPKGQGLRLPKLEGKQYSIHVVVSVNEFLFVLDTHKVLFVDDQEMLRIVGLFE